YAAPVAAFGVEHFTLTEAIAPIVPSWIPWHHFWAYFVGACFIAAGFSLVTRIQSRLAASLLALTFFLFVVLMDIPRWLQNPRDRCARAVPPRGLASSGGALASAPRLTGQAHSRRASIAAPVARYFVAIPVLFSSFEHSLHGDHFPAVPLDRLTPTYIF